LRVLICDDVPELRALARLALESDVDFSVVGEAADAREAVRAVGAQRPDVVVLDLAMPGADGLQGIEWIRRAAPETGIVIFSAFGAGGVRDRALALGADSFVEKGQPLGELRAAVRGAGLSRQAS